MYVNTLAVSSGKVIYVCKLMTHSYIDRSLEAKFRTWYPWSLRSGLKIAVRRGQGHTADAHIWLACLWHADIIKSRLVILHKYKMAANCHCMYWLWFWFNLQGSPRSLSGRAAAEAGHTTTTLGQPVAHLARPFAVSRLRMCTGTAFTWPRPPTSTSPMVGWMGFTPIPPSWTCCNRLMLSCSTGWHFQSSCARFFFGYQNIGDTWSWDAWES